MREIDFLWLGFKESGPAASVFVALFEGLEGGNGLALEAEGGDDFDPFDSEGGTSLGWGLVGVTMGELGGVPLGQT